MKILQWIKNRIAHKVSHFSVSSIKKILKEHGLALVVIIIVWEIIEDILFPVLFLWLGKTVNPIFLAGAPLSLLLCLHWLAVPIAWKAWISISRK